MSDGYRIFGFDLGSGRDVTVLHHSSGVSCIIEPWMIEDCTTEAQLAQRLDYWMLRKIGEHRARQPAAPAT